MSDRDTLLSAELGPGADQTAKLVYNNRDEDIKVITDLEQEFRHCDRFEFSVAFITCGGLACILQYLDNNRDRVTGRILTTDYLNFSEPRALRTLLNFENIDVRMYTKGNFHTKGYLFHGPQGTTLIIGSSNLTQDALSVNKEWNVRIDSHGPSSALLSETQDEFLKMWAEAEPLTEEWIRNYEPRHIRAKIERDRELFIRHPSVITPNPMQEEALVNLTKIRNEGGEKALLVSATGTGKTYLSAFDVRNSKARKVLFLVHREQILDDARRSFIEILGSGIRTGKITGTQKDWDADFIFSTTQSMTKEDTLKRFAPDHFDYIICDEAHHSVSSHYKRIVDYFHPRFLLGMTATPERTDSGDVFALFDHRIAYEIRLQDALREEMLCPFHYYGISDIEVDGRPLDELSGFGMLTSDERVRHILEKADFYGYSGDRVKGLVFCRTKEEGREISSKMNLAGKKTCFICDETSLSEREVAVRRLEQEQRDDALDYIVTVDLFNEGVDIRSVNQIIMLRPTQSATVFIQQLGRGLRKLTRDNRTKEYLVVLDFIGNYQHNFLIPFALSGDRSMNKENLRKYLMRGRSVVPGCSTVDFDRVSEQRIYNAINATKSLGALMKDEYLNLFKMLGYCPDLRYLQRSSKIFPPVIIAKYGSLNDFRARLHLDHLVLSADEDSVLKYLSSMTVNGMRPFESLMLSEMLEHGCLDLEEFKEETERCFNIVADDTVIDSCLRIFDGSFATNRYKSGSLITITGSKVTFSSFFLGLLQNPGLFESLKDAAECGIMIFKEKYQKKYDGKFSLFERYSRKDVVRLLNWLAEGESSTVYGYRVKNGTCPIFVTYRKSEGISKSTMYEDRFVNPKTFSWFTRRNRIDGKEVRQILDPNTVSYLFVRKGDDDSSDFYYLGHVTPSSGSVMKSEIEDDNGVMRPIVKMQLELQTPVPDSLYSYLIGE